jgi:hypothetical protein
MESAQVQAESYEGGRKDRSQTNISCIRTSMNRSHEQICEERVKYFKENKACYKI